MSLSFIDIMACGLGAVALMFIFVKEAKFSPLNTDYSQEASSALDSLESLTLQSNKNQITLNSLKNRIDELIKQIANTELELKISDQVIAELSQANKDILDKIKLANKSKTPINTPTKKTYLSGCNVSGNKIILLLDKSLSMLDKNLVEIFRFSASSTNIQNQAPKWIKGKKIMEWLIEDLPEDSEVLLATFNEDLTVDVSQGQWTPAKDKAGLYRQFTSLSSTPPINSTNLEHAILQLKLWSNADSIYLVTDGLPTHAIQKHNERRCFSSSTVTGKCRIMFFERFSEALDNTFARNTIFNTILLKMEGDPFAPYYFSYETSKRNGCFLTPAENWPL